MPGGAAGRPQRQGLPTPETGRRQGAQLLTDCARERKRRGRSPAHMPLQMAGKGTEAAHHESGRLTTDSEKGRPQPGRRALYPIAGTGSRARPEIGSGKGTRLEGPRLSRPRGCCATSWF